MPFPWGPLDRAPFFRAGYQLAVAGRANDAGIAGCGVPTAAARPRDRHVTQWANAFRPTVVAVVLP